MLWDSFHFAWSDTTISDRVNQVQLVATVGNVATEWKTMWMDPGIGQLLEVICSNALAALKFSYFYSTSSTFTVDVLVFKYFILIPSLFLLCSIAPTCSHTPLQYTQQGRPLWDCESALWKEDHSFISECRNTHLPHGLHICSCWSLQTRAAVCASRTLKHWTDVWNVSWQTVFFQRCEARNMAKVFQFRRNTLNKFFLNFFLCWTFSIMLAQNWC